jgi:NDP-sugar pyrophosphorylase family protein
MLPVAILAGGLATRLQPITRSMPKSLVAVAGKPFVEHQLARLREAGIARVVLCVGHLGEQIEAAVGDGARFGLQAAYSYDGPRQLGTGGALKRALPLLGDAFFVLYGDSLVNCDFAALEQAFRAARKPALMTVFRNAGQWDTSNIVFRDGAILRYDKKAPSAEMQHIDFGVSVATRAALQHCKADEACDLADAYGALLAKGELAALEVSERFYEIGSTRGLEETERYLRGLSR